MVNVDEKDVAGGPPRPRTGTVLTFCGPIECEILELAEDEKDAFRAGYGLGEPGAAKFFRALPGFLNVLTFYTVGKDEVRAWPLRRGLVRPDSRRRHPFRHRKGLHPGRGHRLGRARPAAAPFQKAKDAGAIRLEGKDLRRPGRGRHLLPIRPMTNSFTITARDPASSARAGLLETAHGAVETPAFMPVASQGSVKGLTHAVLEELGAQIILVNAYHLYLRPGADVVAGLGGVHGFISWRKPILSDSGGFQIYSMSPLVKVREEGVRFSSHLDGTKIFLTPEDVVDIQSKLGTDIMMCLDYFPPYPSTEATMREAVGRTDAWAARAKKRHRRARVPAAAVGDQPGRGLPGAEGPGHRRPAGDRLRRIRLRRIGHRRAQVQAPRGPRAGRRPPPPGQAPLSHGHGLYRGHPGGRRARRGHVRLRPPDAQRPERVAVHEPGADLHQERQVRRRTRSPWTRLVPATPAGTSAGPISGTCSSAARSPRRSSTPSIISTFILTFSGESGNLSNPTRSAF